LVDYHRQFEDCFYRREQRHWSAVYLCGQLSNAERKTIERARKDKREGKAATTQAGEFVREEMHHAKEGRHSSGNPKQAIAIGLSKARRAGVDLKPPKKGKASAATRKKAQKDYQRGHAKSSHAKSRSK
jgi:hypothetical protein